MKPCFKISLLFIFISFSVVVTAQTQPKENSKEYQHAKEKAEKAAKEKAEAEAKAKAKEREILKKLLEQQAKSEGSQSKMSEAYAASVNAKAEAFYSTAMSQINSKHVAWIKQNAKKIYVEKLDDISIKVIAGYYGKNAGLSNADIDGLLVLLLRETYLIGKNDYSNYQVQSDSSTEKMKQLFTVKQLIADSSYQLSSRELDSINLLIDNAGAKESLHKSELHRGIQQEKAAETNSKKVDNAFSVSAMSLTQTKLTANINVLTEAQEQQTIRMNEIAQRQQKITQMLSKLVNQVTASQESIINNLK